jgi:hypothetical protein
LHHPTAELWTNGRRDFLGCSRCRERRYATRTDAWIAWIAWDRCERNHVKRWFFVGMRPAQGSDDSTEIAAMEGHFEANLTDALEVAWLTDGGI